MVLIRRIAGVGTGVGEGSATGNGTGTGTGEGVYRIDDGTVSDTGTGDGTIIFDEEGVYICKGDGETICIFELLILLLCNNVRFVILLI